MSDFTGTVASSLEVSVGTTGQGALGSETKGGIRGTHLPAGLNGDGGIAINLNLLILVISFDRLRIPMEHVYIKDSLCSKLYFKYICPVKILDSIEVI